MHIKNQRYHLADIHPPSQSYGFSSNHVWMWELDHKEGWAPKTLESPLENKEIKPVNPKGNQPWIFIGRTDVEAEAPMLWLPDVKSWLIGKDPDAGKDWRQKKGRQRLRWLDSIINSLDMNLSKLCGIVKVREAWHAAVHGVILSPTQISEWTAATAKRDIISSVNSSKANFSCPYLSYLKPSFRLIN